VIHGTTLPSLQRYGQDTSYGWQMCDGLMRSELHEGSYCSQAHIAGANAVPALGFQMVEKGQH